MGHLQFSGIAVTKFLYLRCVLYLDARRTLSLIFSVTTLTVTNLRLSFEK